MSQRIGIYLFVISLVCLPGRLFAAGKQSFVTHPANVFTIKESYPVSSSHTHNPKKDSEVGRIALTHAFACAACACLIDTDLSVSVPQRTAATMQINWQGHPDRRHFLHLFPSHNFW